MLYFMKFKDLAYNFKVFLSPRLIFGHGIFWVFSNEIRSTKNITLYFVIIDNIFKLSFENATE